MSKIIDSTARTEAGVVRIGILVFFFIQGVNIAWQVARTSRPLTIDDLSMLDCACLAKN